MFHVTFKNCWLKIGHGATSVLTRLSNDEARWVVAEIQRNLIPIASGMTVAADLLPCGHHPDALVRTSRVKWCGACEKAEDAEDTRHTCGECGAELQLVRPGKHQCVNPECGS